MEPFVFLEHTADVLFEAHGFSFEEALQNAAAAMFSTIAKVDELGELKRSRVEERAETLEELAVYLLSDLLAESESREVFFKKFVVEKFEKKDGGYSATGMAFGEPMTPEKGAAHVKAVTMHEAKVSQEGNLWKIRVLLDV